MRFHKNYIALSGTLTLILVTLIAYYSVTDAGFIMDDRDFYIDDPVMKKSDGWRQIWFDPFENNHVWPYIPITRSTFWLERQLWGLDLRITHWINVVFHLISAFLLWKVLRQLSIRGAWFAAMYFALHPIHVQSVVWIAERKNVVSGVFFLLTIWGYLLFEKEKRTGWYLLTLGFYLCALLSKTSTVMLPFIFILCRFWFRHPWRKLDLWALFPFFLLAAGSGYVRIWFELNSFGAAGEEYVRSFLQRLLTAAHIPFFYLSKLILPHPLIFTYPKWKIDVTQISLYLPLLSMLIAFGVLLWKYQKWGRPIVLGMGAFGILLFPVMGFFNNAWTRISFVTDHWVYLPSIPILLLLIDGIVKVSEKLVSKNLLFYKSWNWIIWVVIFIALIILTRNQAALYENPKTLWKSTIDKNPDAWFAYAELGREYLLAKQYDLALQNLNKTFELTGGNPFIEIYNYRGLTYLSLKQYEQAIEDYNKALEIDSKYINAYLNRGNAYLWLQQYKQAIEDYEQVIQIDPQNRAGYLNRGNTYLRLQQYERAIEDYNDALRLDSTAVKAQINRGTSFLYLQQYEQAVEDYNAALQITPDNAEIFLNRGTAYRYLKQINQALQDYNKALEIDPNHAGVHINRGLIYNDLNQKALACSDWKVACQLGQCQYYSWARSKNYCS